MQDPVFSTVSLGTREPRSIPRLAPGEPGRARHRCGNSWVGRNRACAGRIVSRGCSSKPHALVMEHRCQRGLEGSVLLLSIILRTIQVAILVGVVLVAKRRGWLVRRQRDTIGIAVLLFLWLLLAWAVAARGQKPSGATPLPPPVAASHTR